MRTLREKLHNDSGASILMALLLLLVALMVSVVILSAALGAAKAIRTDREQQQLSLSVGSAAELLRDSISDGAADYETVTVAEYDTPRRDHLLQQTVQVPQAAEAEGLRGIFIEANALLHRDDYGNEYRKTFRLHVENEAYQDVTAEVLMRRGEEGSYAMTVIFTAEQDSHRCQMVLTAYGAEQTAVTYTYKATSRRYLTTTTRTLRWDPPVITRSATGGSGA